MKTLKYLIFFIFVLLFAYDAYSQNVITKPTPDKKTTPNTQTSPANKFTLKICPNLKCRLKIDGIDNGIVETDGVKKVYLNKGTFLITAISTENPLDKISEEYNVSEVNVQKLYKIDLLSERNKRIAQEQAAKQTAKADSIAKVEAQQVLIRKAKADSIAKEEFIALLNKIGTNMIFVQGGTFTMGCTDEQGSDCPVYEKPSHSVTLNNFYISKYEVTQKQWKAIMGINPSSFTGCDDCPVESVSWDDVQEFITKLNKLTGKVYRLPTEAE